MYTSILGAHAAQVVGSGAWAVGELIGAVCKSHGRELLLQKVENRLPGASKVNSRRSTFEYILKPEVVAIGVRRCGHHRSTAGRDANAVACRMDRAGRLWVAISVARSDV